MSAVTIIAKQAAESTEQSIREWAIAAGTVGATFVAVYVGVLREWRRRPRLTLEYQGPPSGDSVVVRTVRGWVSAYVRVRVTAGKRRSAAEDVEVMILSARELAPREGAQPSGDITIDGQLLIWSNTPSATRLTIPPGTHRHLDLVRVDQTDTSGGNAPAVIEVEPRPADGRHQVRSASFELELAVTARNVDARRYRVVVNYDGGWGDDIWQHLTVEKPERVK